MLAAQSVPRAAPPWMSAGHCPRDGQNVGAWEGAANGQESEGGVHEGTVLAVLRVLVKGLAPQATGEWGLHAESLKYPSQLYALGTSRLPRLAEWESDPARCTQCWIQENYGCPGESLEVGTGFEEWEPGTSETLLQPS